MTIPPKISKPLLKILMTWPGAILFCVTVSPICAIYVFILVVVDNFKRFISSTIDNLKWEYKLYGTLQYPWLVRKQAKVSYEKLMKKLKSSEGI